MSYALMLMIGISCGQTISFFWSPSKETVVWAWITAALMAAFVFVQKKWPVP